MILRLAFKVITRTFFTFSLRDVDFVIHNLPKNNFECYAEGQIDRTW